MEGRGRGRGRGGGRGRGRGRPGADAHRALEGAAPHIVQVVEFARARTQELEALTRAISTTSGSKRAFQTLPRHLRRRAMSHNIKRLPVRLRMQAQNEMDAAPPKGSTTLKRHRKNKRRPGYLLRDYERRQKKNVWLETHIWHAKRFKMVNLWGYKIALHPSDRSVRACYRASAHVCTAHDASYQTCIELSGKEKNILDLLRSMTDPTGPFVVTSRPYLHGKRSGNMMLHHPATFPMGAIAPVSFLWRPLPNPSSDPDVRRQLWVWVHPSASAELLQAFHKVAPQHEVTWTSLKDELVRFELTGPHSHTILTSTLRLAAGGASSDSELGTESKAANIWNALNQLRTPASLPSGAVLAISAEDPRVSFPPLSVNKAMRARDQGKPGPAQIAQQDQALTQALVNEWPTEAVESSLWDKDARDALAKGFYSDAEMVKRKKAQPLFSASNTSGVSMAIDSVEEAQKQETSFAKVPVLLVQRPHKLERGYGAGWDVILPSRWGMAFWKSFIYAGARSIGLREHRKQASEQGLPHFPEDYPDTNAYHDYIQSHAQDLMETYFKKPPAKRPNYDKLAVDSPFFPDFYSLLSLALPGELMGDDDDEDSEEEAEVADREEEEEEEEEQAMTEHSAEDKGKDKMDEDQDSEEGPRPSSSSEEVAMTEFIPRPFFVTRAHHGVPTTASLPSLACVSLRMVDRGVPHYNALVCLPTEDDLALYQARALHRRGSHRFARKVTARPARQEPGDSDDEEEALNNDDEKGPLASLHQHGEREVIGFVTAGDYSYIRGSGSALGFCASAALSAHWPPVLLVRNTSSPFYFPATYSLSSS